jgi:hypothetical protein
MTEIGNINFGMYHIRMIVTVMAHSLAQGSTIHRLQWPDQPSMLHHSYPNIFGSGCEPISMDSINNKVSQEGLFIKEFH